MKKKVLIIAEAGVNHNGSLETAFEMVRIAKEAGADYVKFQTFFADNLALENTPLAEYQAKNNTGPSTQWALLRSLELTKSEFRQIKELCCDLDIGFLSTGFGIGELNFLIQDLEVSLIKIASGDLTFSELLFEAGKSGLPILLSTGMATLEEIEVALKVVSAGLGVHLGILDLSTMPTREICDLAWQNPDVRIGVRSLVTLLHCTSQYPAEPSDLNLNFITTLARDFECQVGYSDHSLGIEASLTAVALGSVVVEKHFTLDKSMIGPDHKASLDPVELTSLISGIRLVEEMLGEEQKKMSVGELSNRDIVRRSLVASCPIEQGQLLTAKNVKAIRPAGGKSAFDFFDILGSRAVKRFETGDFIE
jgi:N-acetylneuraminate synthase